MKRIISKATIVTVLLGLGFLAAQATTATSQYKRAPYDKRLRVLGDCATHFKKQNAGTHSYQCAFRYFPRCRKGTFLGDAKIVNSGRYKVVVYICNEPPH